MSDEGDGALEGYSVTWRGGRDTEPERLGPP
jgi:hypothetical protein